MSIEQAPARSAIGPGMPAANGRLTDPYSLRARAGADGRLLYRRRHASPAVRQARRASRWNTRASTATISRSGRPMRGASSVVGDSTTGTAAAIRCATGFETGIWEVFIPVLGHGHALQVSRSSAREGCVLPLKADPFARQSELRPETASVVPTRRRSTMNGPTTCIARSGTARTGAATPMSIYEVHAGSLAAAARWRFPDL